MKKKKVHRLVKKSAKQRSEARKAEESYWASMCGEVTTYKIINGERIEVND